MLILIEIGKGLQKIIKARKKKKKKLSREYGMNSRKND